MFKFRLRFSKHGALRFIGHLDFLKVFQQTIRRAGLPAAYSQGFNPHLQLSFALPLPLGMASENDYVDIILVDEVPLQDIVDSLNTHAPAGLQMKAAYPVEGAGAAAIVEVGIYDLVVNIPMIEAKKMIADIQERETIIIPKKTKSGIKDTDIKPDIHLLKAIQKDESMDRIQMWLSAGSSRFLNPMLVAELMLGKKPSPAALTRVNLCRHDGKGGIISL
ncbi:MAG: TIGR03936 family radical SAM-associated protein [Defluviitaleaceae bacterium]|nr:TIGR03936 family radical SAM-associated protein [Defluviitaleaceae bacterium]